MHIVYDGLIKRNFSHASYAERIVYVFLCKSQESIVFYI